jgi:hypothetical protein
MGCWQPLREEKFQKKKETKRLTPSSTVLAMTASCMLSVVAAGFRSDVINFRLEQVIIPTLVGWPGLF